MPPGPKQIDRRQPLISALLVERKVIQQVGRVVDEAPQQQVSIALRKNILQCYPRRIWRRGRRHVTQPFPNKAVVAVDADVSGVELKRIAIMAADGFARALRPVHTPFDGDIVFAIATAKRPVGEPRPRQIMRLGSIAADTLSRAIARGVYEAQSLGAMKSYRDSFP